MTIFVFILVLLLSFLLLRWWKRFCLYDHFPGPGKFASLPVVGHAYKMAGRKLHEVMRENHKKYGDIYRFDLGQMPTIFLAKYEDICDAYKTDAFGGRIFEVMPSFSVFRIKDADGDMGGLGTMESRYEKWRETKKFTINTLSALGFGKSTMENIVLDEVKTTCDLLMEKASANNGKVQITRMFAPATNSVIWRIVTGQSTNQTNPEQLDLMHAVKELFLFLETDSLFKLLQINSVWFAKLSKWMGVKDNVYDITDKIQSKLWKEAEAGEPDESGSFIERHYSMQEQHKNDPHGPFNKRNGVPNLKGALWDLFLAGTDTTSTFLEWCVLFLIKYPDIQAKVYLQIKEALGETTPTLADKAKLPYVECFIEECFRCSHMTDLAVPHRVVEDITFKGYFIPKDTQIYADMDAVMNDPNYWDKPEEFRPERFMTPEGKFKTDSRISVFGIGKRRCMGEILARSEAFLFLVGMVQRFEFRQVAEPVMDPVPGLICYPKEYDVNLIARF